MNFLITYIGCSRILPSGRDSNGTPHDGRPVWDRIFLGDMESGTFGEVAGDVASENSIDVPGRFPF